MLSIIVSPYTSPRSTRRIATCGVRRLRAACHRRDASCPMSGDPVGTIPVRWDPHATGHYGRRRIDDRRRNGNDRRNNTEDDRRRPTAASPAKMPAGMPSPTAMIPPRGCRLRCQQCGGKRRNCSRANDHPYTRRDFLHDNCSYQIQQRARSTPLHGPRQSRRQAHPTKVAVNQVSTSRAEIRLRANLIGGSSAVAACGRVFVAPISARPSRTMGRCRHGRGGSTHHQHLFGRNQR